MPDSAEVKALLRKLSNQPWSIALAPGEKTGALVVDVHKSRSPRQLGDDLRDSAGTKQVCFGTVRADADGETLVVSIEGGKSIPSLEAKLQKYLREEKMPYRSVRLDESGAGPAATPDEAAAPAASPAASAEPDNGPGFSYLGY